MVASKDMYGLSNEKQVAKPNPEPPSPMREESTLASIQVGTRHHVAGPVRSHGSTRCGAPQIELAKEAKNVGLEAIRNKWGGHTFHSPLSCAIPIG
jgi:hypothetical protein